VLEQPVSSVMTRGRRHVYAHGDDRGAHGPSSPSADPARCRSSTNERLTGPVSIGDVVAARVRELEEEAQLLHELHLGALTAGATRLSASRRATTNAAIAFVP